LTAAILQAYDPLVSKLLPSTMLPGGRVFADLLTHSRITTPGSFFITAGKAKMKAETKPPPDGAPQMIAFPAAFTLSPVDRNSDPTRIASLESLVFDSDVCLTLDGYTDLLEPDPPVQRTHAWKAECTSTGQLVGHMIVDLFPSQASIIRLCVHPEFRRRGIGRSMIRSALLMTNKHRTRIYCIVEDDNLPMHKLLSSCGYIAAAMVDDSDFRRDGDHAYEFRYLRDWVKADA
jgi:ribosomal protein S18 acetylase RimI-like enzyme